VGLIVRDITTRCDRNVQQPAGASEPVSQAVCAVEVLQRKRRYVMGDKTDRASGTLKEAAGKATGNRGLAQRGRDEQAKGDIKSAGKKTKDAIKKQF
jgi:uncharacterized protein YjbJ (UPF0337 family)